MIVTYFRVLSHSCGGAEKWEKIKISGHQDKYLAWMLTTTPWRYISRLLRKYSYKANIRLQWPTGLTLETTEQSPVQSTLPRHTLSSSGSDST
jgi:hypothetical protein